MNGAPFNQPATLATLTSLLVTAARDDNDLLIARVNEQTVIPLFMSHAALSASPLVAGWTKVEGDSAIRFFIRAAQRDMGVTIDDGYVSVPFSVEEVRLIADAYLALRD
ncbi:hypothetical protein [Dermacoccus sp. GAS27A]|uniref:hypothetical protein n=1 Tax=Dermacoccus sp. GAS27A TaxID=3156270 RepID=UPI003836B23E